MSACSVVFRVLDFHSSSFVPLICRWVGMIKFERLSSYIQKRSALSMMEIRVGVTN